MTLIRLTCDCGTEYVFAVGGEEVDEEPDTGTVDADRQKEADPVSKPALEIDATPSYENPDDPFWAPDGSEENETRIHEADPIELRSQAPDIPTTRRRRRAVGF